MSACANASSYLPLFPPSLAPGTLAAGPPASSLVQRFQFAHGCLKGHLLAGEESFAVEWDKEDDSVW
eukprot:1152094-Pelagomonas_calceolata.AAC.3